MNRVCIISGEIRQLYGIYRIDKVLLINSSIISAAYLSILQKMNKVKFEIL
jgi:hypothetical protein